MMEWIQSNLIATGAAMALAAGLGYALKNLPKYLEEKVSKAIDDLFAMGDEADDAFILAAMVWAEAKYGPGTGPAKAAAVVDKILSLLPLKYRAFVSKGNRDKAVALFQASFDRIESTLAKERQEHGADKPA